MPVRKGNQKRRPARITKERPPTTARGRGPQKVRVGKTDQAIPVRPEPDVQEFHTPATSPAVDRRRQIVGTDEPKGRTRV